METPTWRDMATDALRYWEPRRVAYNLLLAGITFLCVLFNKEGFGRMFEISNLLFLFILAVLANVAYCAAYVADLFLQCTHFRDQRRRWRLVIALVGFAFAAALAGLFSLGMFGDPPAFSFTPLPKVSLASGELSARTAWISGLNQFP